MPSFTRCARSRSKSGHMKRGMSTIRISSKPTLLNTMTRCGMTGRKSCRLRSEKINIDLERCLEGR